MWGWEKFTFSFDELKKAWMRFWRDFFENFLKNIFLVILHESKVIPILLSQNSIDKCIKKIPSQLKINFISY